MDLSFRKQIINNIIEHSNEQGIVQRVGYRNENSVPAFKEHRVCGERASGIMILKDGKHASFGS